MCCLPFTHSQPHLLYIKTLCSVDPCAPGASDTQAWAALYKPACVSDNIPWLSECQLYSERAGFFATKLRLHSANEVNIIFTVQAALG